MGWWQKMTGRNQDQQNQAAGGARPDSLPESRLEARVTGRVQGVGFRYWTKGQADPLGLTGVAQNLEDGSVRVVAEGPRQATDKLLEILDSGDTAGHVDRLVHDFTDPTGEYRDFGMA